MSGWALIPNPAYEGRTPRILEAACHDRTPFLTVRCGCGNELHVHESQLDEIPPDFELATSCQACWRLLVFPPGYFAEAFAQMRADGWIE